MILTDTGPLVALINLNDPYHQAALQAAARLPTGPMVTTWPSFTEAMYLLGQATGIDGQEALWKMIFANRLKIRDAATGEPERMAELMRKYSDLPMDLADASLITAAEALAVRRIFSFDGDFRIYVLRDGTTLELVN